MGGALSCAEPVGGVLPYREPYGLRQCCHMRVLSYAEPVGGVLSYAGVVICRADGRGVIICGAGGRSVAICRAGGRGMITGRSQLDIISLTLFQQPRRFLWMFAVESNNRIPALFRESDYLTQLTNKSGLF